MLSNRSRIGRFHPVKRQEREVSFVFTAVATYAYLGAHEERKLNGISALYGTARDPGNTGEGSDSLWCSVVTVVIINKGRVDDPDFPIGI